ncbi:secreted RxLR effector protein 161-like protein [Tanacetum coccineum]
MLDAKIGHAWHTSIPVEIYMDKKTLPGSPSILGCFCAGASLRAIRSIHGSNSLRNIGFQNRNGDNGGLLRRWEKTTSGFVIIAVYVDDLKIIVTNKGINEVVMHLKEEFKMKDIGRSLNVDNYPFHPCEEDEDVLGPKVLYPSAIGALMNLTKCTGLDISFAVNLLARFISSSTKRYWNGIKHIFRYLRGTTDLSLFCSNNSKQGLVGYARTCYLSNPHKARSQTGYVFLNGGTAISWRSQKQTLITISSTHDEVIALHEASRECV